MNGVLQVFCEVHCIKCERPYLGLPYPKKEAYRELKKEGWQLVNNKWSCWECKP